MGSHMQKEREGQGNRSSAGGQNTESKGDYVREFVTILFIRKRTILAVTALCFVGAILIALLWPPTYSVKGTILVKGRKLEKSPVSIEQAQVRVGEVDEEFLNSEMELLRSPELMQRTFAALQEASPEAVEPLVKNNPGRSVQGMLTRLRTETAVNSNVIRVAFLMNDPDRGRTILGTHLAEYVKYRSELYNPSQAEVFFREQSTRYGDQLKTLEEGLVALAIESDSPDPVREIDNNLMIKKDLQAQLDIARSQLIEKRHTLEYIARSLAQKDLVFFSAINNLPVNKLAEQLQTIFIERGRLLRVYMPGSANVRALDEQLAATQQALVREVRQYENFERSALSAVEEKITSLQKRIAEINAVNLRLQGIEIRRQQIEREREVLKASYDTFSRRFEEARITANSSTDQLYSVVIASAPFFSGTPEFPKAGVVIPLGLLVGLIAGCTLGFLQEYFDSSIKTVDDVRHYLGRPVLFSLPKWK